MKIKSIIIVLYVNFKKLIKNRKNLIYSTSSRNNIFNTIYIIFKKITIENIIFNYYLYIFIINFTNINVIPNNFNSSSLTPGRCGLYIFEYNKYCVF
jgi:hypothetical protein